MNFVFRNILELDWIRHVFHDRKYRHIDIFFWKLIRPKHLYNDNAKILQWPKSLQLRQLFKKWKKKKDFVRMPFSNLNLKSASFGCHWQSAARPFVLNTYNIIRPCMNMNAVYMLLCKRVIGGDRHFAFDIIHYTCMKKHGRGHVSAEISSVVNLLFLKRKKNKKATKNSDSLKFVCVLIWIECQNESNQIRWSCIVMQPSSDRITFPCTKSGYLWIRLHLFLYNNKRMLPSFWTQWKLLGVSILSTKEIPFSIVQFARNELSKSWPHPSEDRCARALLKVSHSMKCINNIVWVCIRDTLYACVFVCWKKSSHERFSRFTSAKNTRNDTNLHTDITSIRTSLNVRESHQPL